MKNIFCLSFANHNNLLILQAGIVAKKDVFPSLFTKIRYCKQHKGAIKSSFNLIWKAATATDFYGESK